MVLLFAIVGFGDVLQHTPLSVTVAPPSLVTFPPDVAVVAVMLPTELVITVGRVAFEEVVNDTSFPYAVPTLFVA
jgi:hypothetical protein